MTSPMPPGPRIFPRVKLTWDTSRVAADWRLGLFGFYARIHGFPRSGLALSLRGALVWLLVLGVAGYGGGAFALSRWLARNPYNQLGYVDVLSWPVHREHVREIRARGWITQGKAALASERWADAEFYLRRGIDAIPADFEARLALAQFYIAIGQRSRGLGLIIDGLGHGLPPRAGLEAAFQVAFAGEDWTSAMALCNRALPQLQAPDQRGLRQWVLGRKLAVLIATNRGDEALALGVAEGDAAEMPVKLQRCLALNALGRHAESLALVERWRTGATKIEVPAWLRLQASTAREAREWELMDRALAELTAWDPALPDAMAFAIAERARAGRGASPALDDYIFRFGGSTENLSLVARELAAIPDPGLLAHVTAAAREHGYPLRPFHVQQAEAWLRQGDLDDLLRLAGGFGTEFAEATGASRLWFDWIKALAESLAAPLDDPGLPIVGLVSSQPLSLEAHKLSVTALRRKGRNQAALQVIDASRRLYAECPWLREQKAEIERALAATQPPVTAAPPSPTAMTLSWDEFSASLDRAVADQRWPAARQLTREARQSRPSPDWLRAHDFDIAFRELKIAHALLEPNALRLAALTYINGDPNRAVATLNLAREWFATGGKDDAIFLAKAVLEKSPTNNVARTLLAEWQPKEKGGRP